MPQEIVHYDNEQGCTASPGAVKHIQNNHGGPYKDCQICAAEGRRKARERIII